MQLFWQALTIMVMGMALVFAFLAIVIQAVNLAARVIHHFEGEPAEETPGKPDPLHRKRLAAAIATALHRHHSKSA